MRGDPFSLIIKVQKQMIISLISKSLKIATCHFASVLLLRGIDDLTLEGSCRLDGVNFHHENDFVVNFYDEKDVVVNFHDADVVVNFEYAENDVVVRQHCRVMNSQHSRRDVRGRDEA